MLKFDVPGHKPNRHWGYSLVQNQIFITMLLHAKYNYISLVDIESSFVHV